MSNKLEKAIQAAAKQGMDATQAGAAAAEKLKIDAARREAGIAAGKLKMKLQPTLKDVQRGLLSKQASGRSQLMSNLARLGVRSGGAAKRVGQFESAAASELASSDLQNQIALESFIENFRKARVAEELGLQDKATMAGDKEIAELMALSHLGKTNLSPITDFLKPIGGAALTAFLKPIGGAAFSGLTSAGEGIAKNIFGDRAVANTGTKTQF